MAALGLLDRLLAAAAEAERAGSLLEIRVLRALAHHADGDLDQALAELARAQLDAPEPDSYARLYMDEGAPMQELLHQGFTEQPDSAAGEVRRLLDRAAAPAAHAKPQLLLADPLSRRELEVLRLLDSELSGPEIAQQLYVSLNTLRTHTRRIFTKLDVNNRAAAVRRAHQLDLM